MHFAEADKPADAAPTSSAAASDVAAEVEKASAAAAAKAKREAAREAARAKDAARLADAEKAAAAKARQAYLDEIKADPGKLFADINDDSLLLKLATARGTMLSPEAQERERISRETAAVKAELDKMKADAAKAEADRAAASNVGIMHNIMTNGVTEGDVKVKAHWPLSAKLTQAGVIAAPSEALAIADRLAADLGRKPTAAEAVRIIEIAFDKIEEREAARARLYAPEPRPATPTKTITSRTSGRGGTAPEDSSKNRARGRLARREELLAGLRAK
jgi:hypothetical protein